MDAPQSQGASFLEEHRSTSFMPLASTPGATHAIESTRASSSTTARSARLQAAVSCPFDGCPYSRQHLSKDTLISHLAARHVSAGQLIPSAVLRMLKHNACPTCRTLHKEGSACQCRGPEQSETQAINTPTAQPTSTQDSQHALGVFGDGLHTPLNEACPPLRPSFEDILGVRISTVRHIPSACRASVASCLASLVEAFIQKQSWEALHRLQCFPKLVLRAPRRAGRTHAKQTAIDISRRLRTFQSGQLDSLWTESLTTLQRDKPARTRAQVKDQEDSLPRSAIQVIRGLIEEGALSKAAKHLLSEGLADASDPVVLERLRALHPAAAPVATGGDTNLPDHMDISLSDGDDACDWGFLAWQAVTSFSPGSAPGPSGLRPGHLKDCLQKVGKGSALQAALGRLAQMGIERGLQGGAREVLCAANVIPLRKKDNLSVRPIAVGETLRRVVGKCLLATDQLKEQMHTFQPRQCGVAVQGATELVGMGLQRFVDARRNDSDWVILTVDVSNAFNTIDRCAILHGCAKLTAVAYNWLRSCYQGHSPLFCQGKLLLSSQTGTHQGDACGPLGFVLGLEQALEAAGKPSLDWECWYLDDGTIVGKPQDVFDYLGRLQVALGNVGLRLNLGKCQLWGPGVQGSNDMVPRYPTGLELDHPGRAVPVIPFVEN